MKENVSGFFSEHSVVTSGANLRSKGQKSRLPGTKMQKIVWPITFTNIDQYQCHFDRIVLATFLHNLP